MAIPPHIIETAAFCGEILTKSPLIDITQYYHETGNENIPSEGAISYGYENAGFFWIR